MQILFFMLRNSEESSVSMVLKSQLLLTVNILFFILAKLFKDPLFHPCTNHISRYHFRFEDKNEAGKV